MKKIATLLLAAGMLFGAATGASAIDFKAKGLWLMSFDMGQNGGFSSGNGQTGFNNSGSAQYKGEDDFEARQRVRLQLDAVASESLSGTVFFEINNTWGKADTGGALGADNASTIRLKQAYLDWMVPNSDLKVRMGIQGLALPSFTTGSQIFNEDVAGISLNYKFNENVGITAFWARPFNDNFLGDAGSNNAGFMDNVDAFGILLPLTFDGVKVTPWVTYAALGPNFNKSVMPGTSAKYVTAGMFPAGGARHNDGIISNKKLDTYGDAIFAGLTGEVTAFDPFRIAWDVNYGSATNLSDGRLNRAGWLASLLFEYKLDWAIPGLYGWYGSGDDGDAANGSERMPSISVNNTNNGFSNFAFNGNPNIAREAILGYSMAGTWGIGVRLKDMSFVENLKHTLRLNYIGGTNSSDMAKKYLSGSGTNRFGNTYGANEQFMGMDPLYMTTMDSALEIGLSNDYKVYDNFTISLDAAYLATWLNDSRSTWGKNPVGKGNEVRDPWNVNVSFVYSF